MTNQCAPVIDTPSWPDTGIHTMNISDLSPSVGAKTFAGTIITNDDRALMFPIVGGRNAGFGLALLAFSLQGQRKAAATLMLCNMVGGIVDVMWCLKHGSEKWIGHVIGSALGAPLVWWLWR